ncbi:MAG: hypothetical protein AB7G44_09355 [Bacteroidia bacterium]
MNKRFHITSLLLAFAALIVSCNDDANDADDLNAVYNDVASQTAYNDVVSIGDESVIDDDLSSFKLDDAEKISAPCATITKDSIGTPWTTTIDFGSVNCLCNDDKNRRGKIVVTHPPISTARDSGAVFHYEFVDYYINDNKLLGFVNVTDSGTNTVGKKHFYIDAIGGLELANGQGSIVWEGHHRKYYDEGYNTPNTRLDDKIYIYGSSSGTTQTGESFTSFIVLVTRLWQRFSVNCRKHFFAGTVTVTPQGKTARTIDYGAITPEVCDDIATVTVNGNTYTIDLDNAYE